MNELRLNSSEYIDCFSSKKHRDIVIKKYNRGEIAFLVNVRILTEGFDSPITKGVCFLHLPGNKTTSVQIIGRCLRLHPHKSVANVILPFSLEEDGEDIFTFLKVMAQNDDRLKQSLQNKKLGGYLSIENVGEEESKDTEFKFNMIYNSLGVLQNKAEGFMK